MLSAEVKKELSEIASKIGGSKTISVTIQEGENRYERKGNEFSITAKNKAAMIRGFMHLFRNSGDFCVTEELVFEDFGLMLDCSRNAVYSMDAVKRLIRIGALLGYNFLHLYTEDTYEVTDEPYFGYMRGRYTKEEIKELDAYAKEYGVELVPCIQTLAHLNSIFRWPAYAPINDTRDILLLEDERTYALIEKIFQTIAECFTSRRGNVGMDEAELVSRGKFYDINGPKNRFEIMRKHVAKVMEIADKYGFQCMMWSDMYFKFAFGSYRDHEATTIDDTADCLQEAEVGLFFFHFCETFRVDFFELFAQAASFGDEIFFFADLFRCQLTLFALADGRKLVQSVVDRLHAILNVTLVHCFVMLAISFFRSAMYLPSLIFFSSASLRSSVSRSCALSESNPRRSQVV
jgi:hypothetical protein